MFGAPLHRKIYLVLLALLGGCMVTSRGLSNVVWVLMLANWVLEGRWREKWQMAKESRLLQAVLVLWLAYCLGAFTASDFSQGFGAIRTRLPMLMVPLVVLTTQPPQKRARSTILWIYAGTVLVVTLIAIVRMLTIPELSYRELVPFMSHIRFALNCSVVIFLCLFEPPKGRWRYAAYALALWLVVFLFAIRSLTAFFMLTVVSLVVILCKRRTLKWIASWLLVVGGTAFICWLGIRSYYRLCPLATEPLRPVTANGRPYTHHNDGLIECGNYVYNYVCLEELRAEWPKRSPVPLDSINSSDYPLDPILIRYLNALGLTKDSAGIAALTDDQVRDIEQGYANPVYAHGSLPKQILYSTLFEYENHRNYNDAIAGFSMLQRLEMWRAAWHVANQHPWFGDGLFNMPEKVNSELHAMGSPLADQNIHIHSQYLLWLIAFGRIGLIVIALAFLRASPALRRQSPLLLAWTLVILLSFATEITLGTLAERLFCTWCIAFRAGSAKEGEMPPEKK